MSIVTGKYSSEYQNFVNGTLTGVTAVFSLGTEDENSHLVDIDTFASTNLGDDIEVTTVVTVTNKAISQVAATDIAIG